MGEDSKQQSAPEGWYADPSGEYAYRYWDGSAWTRNGADAASAPDPIPIAVPGASTAATLRIVRRLIWSLYAWPTTLYLVSAYIRAYERHGPFVLADLCIAVPGLIALQLHIWDKPVFRPAAWKAYSFTLVAWELVNTLWLSPQLPNGEPLPLGAIIASLVLLLPFYVSIFRYAFRSWSSTESP